jgi:hypothetical protein
MPARAIREATKMKKVSLVSLACATALAISPAVLVGQTVDFSYTYSDSQGVSASGTLTGTLIAPDEYDITSGTISITSGGAVQGSGGVLLSNPNAPGTTTNTTLAGGGTYLTYDDLLFPGSNPQLDGNGLLFDLNGVAVNIWGDGVSEYQAFEGNYLFNDNGSGTFNAVNAPEGGAALLYLLVAGGACFGAMFFSSRSRIENRASI